MMMLLLQMLMMHLLRLLESTAIHRTQRLKCILLHVQQALALTSLAFVCRLVAAIRGWWYLMGAGLTVFHLEGGSGKALSGRQPC